MSASSFNFTRRRIVQSGLAGGVFFGRAMMGAFPAALFDGLANAQETTPPLSTLPFKTGAKVAFLGDSIIRRGHAVPTQREMSSYARGEHFWAKVYDQRFRIETWYDEEDPYGRAGGEKKKGPGFNGANQGIDGDHSVAEFTVPGTLSRVAYTLARNPDIVVLHVGTNDINSGIDAKTVITRLEENLAAIRAGGKWAVISTIYPRSTSGRSAWPTGHVKWKHRRSVNEYIIGLAGRPGVMVFDPNPLLTKQGDGDEQEWVPGFSDDGVHPDARGAEPAGKALAGLLAKMIAPGSVIETDPTRSNLLPDAQLLGANIRKNAQVTGAFATNWEVAIGGRSNVVGSKETVDRDVEKQILTITPADDGNPGRQDTIAFVHPEIALSSAGIGVGDWIQFGVFLETSAWDGWIAHCCQVAQRQGRDIQWISYAGKPANREAELMPVEGVSGWWYSDPVQINAAADRLRMSFNIEVVKTAAGTGTIKISRPFLRKVADPRPQWAL